MKIYRFAENIEFETDNLFALVVTIPRPTGLAPHRYLKIFSH
jgi:hypothetical protein